MFRAQPNIAVLYPCDAVSAERLVAGDGVPPGPGLHAHEPAEDAGDLRQRRDVRDRRAEGAARERRTTSSTVVGAGVTVFEALKAYDELKAAGTLIRVIDLYSVAPVDAPALDRGGPGDRRPHHHGRGSLCGGWHRRCGGGSGQAGRDHGRTGLRSARFRAAASRTSCSSASASRPRTSSRPSARCLAELARPRLRAAGRPVWASRRTPHDITKTRTPWQERACLASWQIRRL